MNRVSQFATLAKMLPIEKPLNFYSFPGKDGNEIVASDMYPALHASWAVDFFFLVGIHQYGFWHGEKMYEGPLLGTLGGRKVKGSDLLWKLLLRAFQADPAGMNFEQLALMSHERWESIMCDDNGIVPLLASKERLLLTHQYAEYFHASSLKFISPDSILRSVRSCDEPAKSFLMLITDKEFGIPGYREDQLNKKALLLMMSLANRPEQFLVPEKSFAWDPIVDYHLMRLALRLGLVVLPSEWEHENIERKFTTPVREEMIRELVFDAVKSVITQSGRTMAEIDNLMWSARRFCPEVETPNCATCMLSAACEQRVELFQPIIRTKSY